ncbi:alpha/beta hydrolase [Actinoplanes utahensis]|uniref:DUF1023 domain-containing protein n=1 Tax=Actinoplanes utahensis TaxID=1869 RepID=A0A0A6UJW0_ACTUT|nr:alpha/beta hydrolase [Actinoplanes utahensis]KHD76390.1 hypothetical protein MB27_16890 [Actinoplanes utahensis]GIF29836.1 hypothetical protein Aut01nite_28220 [Actinoplanes utahensis]
MSTLTLEQLLAGDVTAWHTSADAWQRLAQRTDDATERMIRGTRDLEAAWPSGAGATAAHARSAALRTEISNFYNPAKRVFEAMDRHAYGMTGYRRYAEEIIAAAQQSGLTVDTATLNITAPASAYTGGQLDQTGRAIGMLTNDLRAVVEQARALDDETADAITVNVPAAATGFGLTKMPDVTADDIRAQANRTPKEVNEWWSTLTPEQQDQAIAQHPELVGWLDGVPATDRDTANRIMLGRQTDDLNQQKRDLENRLAAMQSTWGQADPMGAQYLAVKRQLDEVNEKLGGLNAISNRLDEPGRPPAFLLGISTEADGKAIVAVNNPDQANNVVTYVPGTTADLGGAAGDMERADRMVADAGLADPDATTSAVYWLGYDAPDLPHNAASSGYARDGAEDLTRFQGGLRATHEGDQDSRNTVLGHSYGSTVIGHAGKSAGFAVDAAIFVGSPGVDANHVSELPGLPPDKVYATRAQYDVIKWVPGLDIVHGDDPVDPGFGAKVFPSDRGDRFGQVDTHSAYWNEGNVARDGIADIITGRGL